MKAPKLARVCSIFLNALQADRKKTKKKKTQRELRNAEEEEEGETVRLKSMHYLLFFFFGGGEETGRNPEWWIRFQSEEPAGFLQEEPLSVGERRNHADLQSAGCRLR